MRPRNRARARPPAPGRAAGERSSGRLQIRERRSRPAPRIEVELLDRGGASPWHECRAQRREQLERGDPQRVERHGECGGAFQRITVGSGDRGESPLGGTRRRGFAASIRRMTSPTTLRGCSKIAAATMARSVSEGRPSVVCSPRRTRWCRSDSALIAQHARGGCHACRSARTPEPAPVQARSPPTCSGARSRTAGGSRGRRPAHPARLAPAAGCSRRLDPVAPFEGPVVPQHPVRAA